MRVGRKGEGVGQMVATAKQRSRGTTQMVEFRVAMMMSMCTHKGPIIQYKA